MPSPEERLAARLKEAVPESSAHISADAVVDLVWRRRRRAVAPAAAALLVAGIAAAAVTLSSTGHPARPAAGASSTVGSPPPVVDSSGSPSSPAQTQTAAPYRDPPGCPKSVPYPPGVGAEVDYTDFLDLHGVGYLADDRPRPGGRRVRLGPTVGRVTCDVGALPPTRHYVTTAFGSGSAASLPVGTTIHSVPGYPVSCRVGVRVSGGVVQYLAQQTGTRRATPRPCALRAGR